MKFRLGLVHFQEKSCPRCHRPGVIYFDWDEARFKCRKCKVTILNPYTDKFEEPVVEEEFVPKEVELNQNWLDFMKYQEERLLEKKEGK